MPKSRYYWYTDTHFDKVSVFSWLKFIYHIRKDKPKGIFITGDISNGILTCFHLEILAKYANCPIYFVLGNHDYHFSSIDKTHAKIRKLCLKYKNLIWLTDAGVIPLSDECALIGTEGWYDAKLGNPKYLRFTVDWFLTEDFRNLKDMNARIDKFRELSDNSTIDISNKLQQALDQGYKTVYLLTHFPPWKEATRNEGTFLEKFWLPYNTNIVMGQALEQIMANKKKRKLIVYSGHTHQDCWIHVSRNIECKVNEAKYYGSLRNEEIIFI